jgi:hypothetical protein
MGYADSPPIAVPKEIHDNPNADIFDIIHEAYERHRGQMIPQPNQPGGGQPGITPEEAKEAERQLNPLPTSQSYPDPTQDPDFQPLPEKQNGPGQGQGGGGQAGGGQGGGGQALVLNASQKRLIRRYPLMLNQCFRLVSSPQKGNHDRPKDSRFRSKLDMKPARPSSTKLQTVLAPLFLALSLVAGRASDDRGFAVLGFGNKSCGTYVEARSERYGDSDYRGWMKG